MASSFLERTAERGRSFFQRATGATPRPEPSILDHARSSVDDAAGRAYVWIKEQSPWAARRIDDAVTTVSEMDSRGYSRHFGEFNEILLKPLREGMNEVVDGVKATATCTPAQNPKQAFILWNALCFWLAVVLLFVNLLLPFGSPLADVVGIFVRYFFAYTLHFVFVLAPQRNWLLTFLLCLAFYVSVQLFAGFAGLVLLLPALISFARAFGNGILFFHAYSLFVQLEGGADAMEML